MKKMNSTKHKKIRSVKKRKLNKWHKTVGKADEKKEKFY